MTGKWDGDEAEDPMDWRDLMASKALELIHLGMNPPEWRCPLGYDERDAKI